MSLTTFTPKNPATGDVLDPVRELLQDTDAARVYLTERWIGDAMLTLRRARRQAGLSQVEIAERMDTKQPSIARLEGDQSGSVTLHRYAEFLAACGFVPFDLELAESEQVRMFLFDDPDASVLATKFKEWMAVTLMNEAEPASNIPTADARRELEDRSVNDSYGGQMSGLTREERTLLSEIRSWQSYDDAMDFLKSSTKQSAIRDSQYGLSMTDGFASVRNTTEGSGQPRGAVRTRLQERKHTSGPRSFQKLESAVSVAA